MSASFRILIHRSDESTHFKLTGDLDDKAASELIDALNIHSRSVSKIFIHTDSLDRIDDYVKQEFRNRLHDTSNGYTAKILSTGRYSRIFASPEGMSF